EDGAGGAGAAVGEAQRDPGGGRGGAARGPSGAGGGGPQGAGGGGVDGADGVVELPDAGEAGREGDGRHRQIGGLEQDPGGVGALRAGEGDGSGADLGGELALHLPGAVAEPCGEPGDALAVDDTVGDQPHGTADHVGPHVPLGGAGHGVRPAAPAGPEPGLLGGGG